MAAASLKPTPSLDVIAVLRVSTQDQDVARQRTDIERLKSRFGLNIIRTLELVGLSGTATLDDKDIQKVLADLKKPGVGGIAVSSLDRLFRPGKRFGQFRILDYFVDDHKVIYSQREGLIDPSTDEGYDKCIQAGGRGGAEWRTLRQRSIDGKAEKVREGKMVGPAALYSYNYVPKHWKDGRKLGQCLEFGEETKLDVVRGVYQEGALHTPIYRIAKRLNEAGVLSAKGGLWSRQTILQMLKNPAYNGRFLYNGEVIPCPKLINDDLWNKVQEVRANGKQQWTGRPSELYLFRGFMWCSRCGHRSITYRSGNRKAGAGFYRCGNRTNHPPIQYLCDADAVRQEAVEGEGFDMLWEILTNVDLLLAIGQAYYDAMGKTDTGGVEKLEQEAARLKEDQATIIEMVKRRMITMTEGEIDLKKIRERIAEIETELKAVGKVLALPPRHMLEAALREIAKGPKPQSYADRRNILEAILDLRMTYLNGVLQITGKVPVSESDSLESTNRHEKKCNRRIDGAVISSHCIPFILKRRVA